MELKGSQSYVSNRKPSPACLVHQYGSLLDTMLPMTPKKLHRIVAYLEMFTWTFLIVGMILKYSGVTDAVTSIAGGIHGFGFLCFMFITTLVWINNKWPFGIGVLGLFVSVVPWAALPFALWADRKGLLEGNWRYTNRDEKPHGLFDNVLAQVVRHPVRSILIVFIVVVIVFSVLLMLGPPVDVESAIEGQTN